jgi:DNA topoisomerase II
MQFILHLRITFTPDLEKFGMTELDDDICALFHKRVYDIAATSHQRCNVYLNGEVL